MSAKVHVLASFVVCLPAYSLFADDALLQKRANEIHLLTWNHFVEPSTCTILERLDVSGKPIFIQGLRVSPTLEDSAFMTAELLDALVLRHKVSQRPGAAEQARRILGGLLKIATVSPYKGLLARGVHPDGITYWGHPSVDQYTGVFFGLWRYYRSQLATVEEKELIRAAVINMLVRLEDDRWMITDENGDTTNVWDLGYLAPTRAERLLSFLMIGYDLTGDGHWLRTYQKKKLRRLELCRNFDVKDFAGRRYPSWVQQQTAMSLRALLDLVEDPSDLAVYREGARTAAESAVLGSRNVTAGGKMLDLAAVYVVLLLDEERYYGQALYSFRDAMLETAFTRRRTPSHLFEYVYYLAASKGLVKYDPLLDLETPGEAYRMWHEDVDPKKPNGTIGLR